MGDTGSSFEQAFASWRQDWLNVKFKNHRVNEEFHKGFPDAVKPTFKKLYRIGLRSRKEIDFREISEICLPFMAGRRDEFPKTFNRWKASKGRLKSAVKNIEALDKDLKHIEKLPSFYDLQTLNDPTHPPLRFLLQSLRRDFEKAIEVFSSPRNRPLDPFKSSFVAQLASVLKDNTGAYCDALGHEIYGIVFGELTSFVAYQKRRKRICPG